MAVFNITVQAKGNLPPSQIGDNFIKILGTGDPYRLRLEDFTTETNPIYIDPENDPVSLVKITTLVDTGGLELDSVPVVLNQEITVLDIGEGLLRYLPLISANYMATFSFDLADEGSNTFSGLTPGVISIKVAEQENLPPSVVDDGSTTVAYAETVIFTGAMFQNNYADPEADPAFELKILTLPVLGALMFDGEPMVINQVILFEDIDNDLFTYIPDLVDIDGDLQTFTFAIADSGSGQFTS